MHISPVNTDDLKQIPELQPEGWGDIVPAVQFYTKSDFCYPVKITEAGCLAGIGTAIIHEDTSWIAHVIVHPQFRNKGLGSLITQTLIESLHKKGLKTIYLVATDIGAPVYKKLGFEVETEYLYYKNLIPESFTSGQVKCYQNQFKNQIAGLDLLVSGENRMTLLEPHLKDSFVVVCNNQIEGFYLPSLGEGLVIAVTESAGHELMRIRLMTKENASFPASNVKAKELMESKNYKIFKTVKRMVLGTKRNWQPQYIFNRTGGNLG